MFDIITIEGGDDVVRAAIRNIVTNSNDVVTVPAGNYRLWDRGNMRQQGDGGAASRTLVIVGHGSPTELSGKATWLAYKAEFNNIDWAEKTRVFLISCSTAAQPDGDFPFLDQNIAAAVKRDFAVTQPQVVVWASSATVDVENDGLEGNWEKL